MYPDESSRVLVYWLGGHNMLGWCMYIGLWKYIWLHDKIFLALAYPFAYLIALYVVLLPFDDHQFIDGSRCERYSRLTEKGWFHCTVYLCWTSCLFGLFFRVKARVLYCPKALFRILAISYSFWVVGIVVSFSISF